MINLIIQTYNEKNKERLNEYIFCIEMNIKNNNIEKIYNLIEDDNLDYLPEYIQKSEKIKIVNIKKRLTFKDIFDFCNNNDELKGKICCFSNLDIYLTDDWNLKKLNHILNDNIILAQSRHEYNNGTIIMDEEFSKIFHSHTQDAWLFLAPVNISKDIDTDFLTGLLGCDNAIAHRLKISGYDVMNMPQTFKIVHVDSIRNKNSSNFMKFHKENEKIENTHPENYGQYLVPNYDQVRNIPFDNILAMLGFTPKTRALLIADLINNKMTIKN
jgi:hypothetical protein